MEIKQKAPGHHDQRLLKNRKKTSPAILDPRDTYADAAQWEEKAKDLAQRFIKNFHKYEGAEKVGVGSVMPRSVPASLAVKPERK